MPEKDSDRQNQTRPLAAAVKYAEAQAVRWKDDHESENQSGVSLAGIDIR
jgi:hypothetical protein